MTLSVLGQMIAAKASRRAADAERFRSLDWDQCQLCLAAGEDKRTLALRFFYDVAEVVPEAIEASGLTPDERARAGLAPELFVLRCCKACRGRFLAHLRVWRAECLANRGKAMDHDGNLESDDPERNVPVRENGAVVMLTRQEWDERTKRGAED